MTVGKAIYYLLSNYTDLTDIVSTRIFPEVAEQDSAVPFVIYSVISNEPSDTHEGPSKLDVAQVDVVMYNTDYSELVDMGVAVRAALDRVTGTYNGVGVQSIQYTSEIIDFEDYSRAYILTQSFDVRISRTDFEIAQGTPVTGANIIDLADTPSAYGTTGQVLAMNATVDGVEWVDAGGAINELNDVGNVTITDPLDRQALVYDEATDSWINDGVGSLAIPIRNNSPSLQLAKGTVVQFAGTQGDRILVELWDNASPSAYIVGVLSEPLAGGADGHAQTYGELRALDTSAYTLNSILYANAGGTFTTTPNSLPIASVTRVHANTGRIFIRLYVPGDHYRDRFRAEAHAAATASSIVPATVENYYTAQANGDGYYQSKGSDTPRTEGDVVRRTIFWKAGAFAAINASGYTEVALDDNATYADLLAAVDDILNANGAPITIWSKREEVTPSAALLDGYTDDLVGAFAPVLLVPDYEGACMRVRRSGDNAEQDIGFDGIDLDRAAIASFCSPGDGFVKTWYNQDGSSNDLDQGTNADQAKIYDAATGVVLKDAINALDFASNDWMQSPAGVIGSVTGLSFAYVGAFKSTGTSNQIMFAASDGSYGGPNDWFAMRQQSGFNSFVINSGGTQVNLNNGTSDTSMHLFFGSFIGGSQCELAVDGTNATASTALTSLALTDEIDVSMIDNSGSKLLKTNQFSAALVVWNADKSADRAAIETALNDYFNIY